MELALASFASLGTAGAATGAAAGAGGLGAFFSSGPLSILSGATSAVSALQTLQQGNAKAQQAEFEAGTTRNDIIGVQASTLQKQTANNRELLKTLGENDVAYAASGVDLGSGVAADSRSVALSRASQTIATDQATGDATIAGLNARALNYDRMARQYRSGALLGAIADAGKGLLQFGRRGVV